MSNEDPVAVLKQGIKAWNEWRHERRGFIDERGGGHRNMSITYADLSRTSFHSADLQGADLSNVDLTRANLAHANLSRADLRESQLNDALLAYANLMDEWRRRHGDRW